MADVLAALKQLDATKDEAWTTDGLPRLDAVKQAAGDPTLTREAIEAAAPGFNRTNAGHYTPPPPAPPAAAEAPAAPGTGTETAPAAPAAPASEAPSAPSTDGAAAAPAPTADPAGSEVGQTESSQVAGDTVDRSDEIADLETALATAREAEDAARGTLDSVTKDYEAKRNEADRLQARLEALQPPPTVVDVIQSAQAATLAALEERARRKMLIHESGIDLKELGKGLRSPLDQAMSRKSGFGTQRPKL